MKSPKTRKMICLIYSGAIYKNSKTDRYVKIVFPFICLRFLQVFSTEVAKVSKCLTEKKNKLL